MHPAQAGDLSEHLGQENRRRFFRKHLYRFLHVVVAPTVGLQVEDAVGWLARMAVSPETVGDIDHDQGQIRRMRASRGRDMQEVLQAPGLLSLSTVKRDVAPQTVLVHAWCVRQGQGTPEQHDMGTGLGAHVRLGDDDAMQGGRALLMEPVPLGEAGLDGPLPSRLCEGWPRQGLVSHLVAILAPGTSPSSGTSRGEVPRRLAPQLGKKVPAALARPRQGVVGATGASEHARGPREPGGAQAQQGFPHSVDPHEGWGERAGGLLGVRAALRTSRAARGASGLPLWPGGRPSLRRGAPPVRRAAETPAVSGH